VLSPASFAQCCHSGLEAPVELKAYVLGKYLHVTEVPTCVKKTN